MIKGNLKSQCNCQYYNINFKKTFVSFCKVNLFIQSYIHTSYTRIFAREGEVQSDLCLGTLQLPEVIQLGHATLARGDCRELV